MNEFTSRPQDILHDAEEMYITHKPDGVLFLNQSKSNLLSTNNFTKGSILRTFINSILSRSICKHAANTMHHTSGVAYRAVKYASAVP